MVDADHATPPSMIRDELLREIEAVLAEWEGLLARAEPIRLNEPGVEGDWSAKDLAAHVASYQRWLLDELADGAGRLPSPPATVDLADLDQRNAWFYRLNRDRPLEDVLGEARETIRTLLEVIRSRPEGDFESMYAVTADSRLVPESMTEEAIFAAPLAEWLADNTVAHYRHHLPSLRAWLAG